MAITEKRKETMIEYAKKNLKRVPLDIQKDKYEEIKAAAKAAGESVNGFIKTAVDLRMMMSPEDAKILCEKYFTKIPLLKSDTSKSSDSPD